MKTSKTAIISGGSRGIGLAIAQGLAEDGFIVTICARSEKELQSAKDTFSDASRVRTIVADVSDERSVRNAIDQWAREFQKLDVLINAAGVIAPIGPIEAVAPEDWLKLLTINVFGTFLTTHVCAPFLKESGNGTIVNFVGGGEGAFPNFSAYASSKGAIARFTETAAAEFKESNIMVNAIAPGPVNTKMTDDMIAAGMSSGAHYQQALQQKNSDTATPEKATALVRWLCSDKSRGVTGKILSAVWDKYEELPQYLDTLRSTDIYTVRRVRPEDRGFNWGER